MYGTVTRVGCRVDFMYPAYVAYC